MRDGVGSLKRVMNGKENQPFFPRCWHTFEYSFQQWCLQFPCFRDNRYSYRPVFPLLCQFENKYFWWLDSPCVQLTCHDYWKCCRSFATSIIFHVAVDCEISWGKYASGVRYICTSICLATDVVAISVICVDSGPNHIDGGLVLWQTIFLIFGNGQCWIDCRINKRQITWISFGWSFPLNFLVL